MPKEYRKNLQCKQPNIEYTPEDNGWPEPLTDQSNPIRYAVVDGKNGSVESRPVASAKGS